jgi:H+/Cl- antiporter ClcA
MRGPQTEASAVVWMVVGLAGLIAAALTIGFVATNSVRGPEYVLPPLVLTVVLSVLSLILGYRAWRTFRRASRD